MLCLQKRRFSLYRSKFRKEKRGAKLVAMQRVMSSRSERYERFARYDFGYGEGYEFRKAKRSSRTRREGVMSDEFSPEGARE